MSQSFLEISGAWDLSLTEINGFITKICFEYRDLVSGFISQVNTEKRFACIATIDAAYTNKKELFLVRFIYTTLMSEVSYPNKNTLVLV